ncbi:Prefoldin subunit-domain-containing protein [Amylostereum chailletii]|nr:Prefoldin subunit-domain-containing protein [Amylostereum chailletii]
MSGRPRRRLPAFHGPIAGRHFRYAVHSGRLRPERTISSYFLTTLAMSSTKKAKSAAPLPLSDQEVQQTYSRFQNELQSIAAKIGELEQEAEEHLLVLSTLNEALAEEPERKCFRLIGGVLVERTVKDVVPALETNRDGIRNVVTTLAEQYKGKENEFDKFKQEYNIRPARG